LGVEASPLRVLCFLPSLQNTRWCPLRPPPSLRGSGPLLFLCGRLEPNPSVPVLHSVPMRFRVFGCCPLEWRFYPPRDSRLLGPPMHCCPGAASLSPLSSLVLLHPRCTMSAHNVVGFFDSAGATLLRQGHTIYKCPVPPHPQQGDGSPS
jgi:hypothetical protein